MVLLGFCLPTLLEWDSSDASLALLFPGLDAAFFASVATRTSRVVLSLVWTQMAKQMMAKLLWPLRQGNLLVLKAEQIGKSHMVLSNGFPSCVCLRTVSHFVSVCTQPMLKTLI